VSDRDREQGSARSPERDQRPRFDPVLPDHTRDEEGAGWGEAERDDDERLRREVPPHHG
jgi:hypothetical protein